MARVVFGERDTDMADLRSRARRAAGGFAAAGIGKGDCVALLMRNDVAMLEAMLAADMLGACAVPINWHASPAEAAYILGDCGAGLLVAHADLHRPVATAIPAGVRILLANTPREIAEAYRIAPSACRADAGMGWDEWIAGHEPLEQPETRAPGAIIYTSGTTGRPKGVRRPQPTQTQAAGAARLVSLGYGLAAREKPIVSLLTAPLYHSAPNMHTTTSLHIGANLVLLPRFDAEGVLALIERHRVTHAYFAPIMFRRMLQLPQAVREKYDLSSLEFVVHAAAPCPPEVKRAMIEWWGPVINEFYGSTETRGVTGCSSAEWLERPGTVGRPLGDAVLRILDDDGRDCPPLVPGEVVCGHPHLADFTYHGDDAKRQAAGRNGLIATGDIGFLDEAGYLFLCDRKADMIISGGVNIYPAEIEAELALLPGVRDCAVFGIPDEEFGEAVHAVVEAEHGQSLNLDAMRDALRERLSGYKVPRRIEQVPSLPREDSGKIFKRLLRAPYWQEAGRKI